MFRVFPKYTDPIKDAWVIHINKIHFNNSFVNQSDFIVLTVLTGIMGFSSLCLWNTACFNTMKVVLVSLSESGICNHITSYWPGFVPIAFNLLIPGRFEWHFIKVIFDNYFNDWWPRHLLWNRRKMKIIGPQWSYVNVGSGDGSKAITWAHVDPDLCRHVASLGPNEFKRLQYHKSYI